jgi:hypothetical protein
LGPVGADCGGNVGVSHVGVVVDVQVWVDVPFDARVFGRALVGKEGRKEGVS